MKHHTLIDFGLSSQTLKLIFLLSLTALLFSLLIALLLRFLRAFGVYNQAKSLGFENSALAFVPFADKFMLGKVASAYTPKSGKKWHSAGKTLVFFYAVTFVFFLVFIISAGICAVDTLYNIDAAVSVNAAVTDEVLRPFNQLIIPSLLLLAFSLIYKIFETVALFKVYSIFSKSGVAVMTVFSFIFPILIPFFLYSLRKNEPVTSYSDRNDNNFAAFNYGAD